MKKKIVICLGVFASTLLNSCSDDKIINELSDDGKECPQNVFFVSENEARLMLSQFLSQSETRNNPLTDTPVISSCYTVFLHPSTRSDSYQEDSTAIYIFNIGEEDGYAVMSSDIRKPPIYVCTNSGSLIPNTKIGSMNEEMLLAAVERYENQFDLTPIDGTDPRHHAGMRTYNWVDTYYNGENGMCDVFWHQNTPYNMYCFDKNGNNAPVGCGAIAVGQLMSIHEYPTVYGNYSFNWDDMKSGNTEGVGQVARLLKELGNHNNLDITYSNEGEGSGGSFSNIPRTFVNMGYAEGGVCEDYNTNKIVNDLSNGYPVIIAGSYYRKSVKDYILGFIPNGSHYEYSFSHGWLGHGLKKMSRKIEYIDVELDKVYKTETQEYWYVLCNFGEKIFNEQHNLNTYYLSGLFDDDQYPDISEGIPLEKEGYEGTYGHYSFNLRMVTGIRK